MASVASQITSLTIVHSTVYSCADQRKHQSSASLAFVRGIHQPPVFPFDDVIMKKPVRIWVKPTGTKPQWIIRCVNRVRKFSYALYHRHIFNVKLITHHPASYLNKPWSCTRYEQWISKVAPVSLVWYIYQTDTYIYISLSIKAVSKLLQLRLLFMMTSPNGNIFRVTGPLWAGFTGKYPSQRPVTRSFDVFFDLRLHKRLSK